MAHLKGIHFSYLSILSVVNEKKQDPRGLSDLRLAADCSTMVNTSFEGISSFYRIFGTLLCRATKAASSLNSKVVPSTSWCFVLPLSVMLLLFLLGFLSRLGNSRSLHHILSQFFSIFELSSCNSSTESNFDRKFLPLDFDPSELEDDINSVNDVALDKSFFTINL